jgi:hypothetical protein
MALTDAYVLPTKRIGDVFEKVRDGQAPQQFTHQLLKDWGFSSTNDRAFIGLLKALGFLSSDGKPTPRYHEYRDHSRSGQVMAAALREAYGDLFLIKQTPSSSDEPAITGKFRSFHNASDNVAGLMAKTFFGLLPLADLSAKPDAPTPAPPDKASPKDDLPDSSGGNRGQASLHYNIQVHLPATKDVEVYNAIFKSLREHLF